jgi:predicted outer membrane protein
MTKSALLAAFGLSVAALSTPVLAQEPLAVRVAPQFNGTEAPVTDTSDFRAAALRSDAVSIESSRIALERSRNPRVRQYAHNVLVERKATTQALLPEGTSLTAGGTVVSDTQPFETRLDNPVGVVLAPVTISATIAQRVVGGVLGGVGLVDNSPTEPGRRVAIGADGQARIDRLKSAPNARDFDRTYVQQQARSDARTLGLYASYARNGDDAQGREFANQALPYIAGEHAHSANLADRVN